MSNLTQFFGSIPSTADTATPITGTTMQALTAGDGVKLGDNGEFAKTAKSDMKKASYTVSWNEDRSATVNDGLNLRASTDGNNATSDHARYTQNNHGARGIVLSDGTYIQPFYQNINSTGGQYYGFRSFLTSNDENHMHYKSYVSGRSGTTSNMYYYNGCHFREIRKDSGSIYVAAFLFYGQSNSYYYGRQHIIKMNRTTKDLTIVGHGESDLIQIGHQTRGMVGGCGTAGILANGVFVDAYQKADAQNDQTGRLKIRSAVYDVNSPTALAAGTYYEGAVSDHNNAIGDLVLHDETSRTFLSFESPVSANNSKLVKKHVFAADGTLTTTTVATAFTLSNFSNAATNKYFRVVKVSTGVYAAVFAETNNVWSIQKFTWDGNTTLTQTGSRIDLTLPTGLTIEGFNSNNCWYYHDSYEVAGDESNLIIEHGSAATSKNANQNAYSINLVAGTLNFGISTFGLGNNGAHLQGGCFIYGKDKTIVIPNGAAYNDFNYQKFDSSFFKHTEQTKEVVGIALADAVAGATDASIALLDGLKSTTALPTGTFIVKNGQYYLLDVATTIGSPPKKFKKDAVFGGDYAYLNSNANVSSRSYSAEHTGVNSAVQNHSSVNYPSYTHKFSKSCPASQTTTIVSISGSGAISSDIRFWNGYHTTYYAGWEILIDGAVFFKKLYGAETQGTQGYYGKCNFFHALPNANNSTLYFDKSMEIKCVTPNNTATNWCAFNLYTRT